MNRKAACAEVVVLLLASACGASVEEVDAGPTAEPDGGVCVPCNHAGLDDETAFMVLHTQAVARCREMVDVHCALPCGAVPVCLDEDRYLQCDQCSVQSSEGERLRALEYLCLATTASCVGEALTVDPNICGAGEPHQHGQLEGTHCETHWGPPATP